jgi:hypothetical protein
VSSELDRGQRKTNTDARPKFTTPLPAMVTRFAAKGPKPAPVNSGIPIDVPNSDTAPLLTAKRTKAAAAARAGIRRSAHVHFKCHTKLCAIAATTASSAE